MARVRAVQSWTLDWTTDVNYELERLNCSRLIFKRSAKPGLGRVRPGTPSFGFSTHSLSYMLCIHQ